MSCNIRSPKLAGGGGGGLGLAEGGLVKVLSLVDRENRNAFRGFNYSIAYELCINIR